MSLDRPGRLATHNHLGLAIAGEALRAWRENATKGLHGQWREGKSNLVAFLQDELTNGMWRNEVLVPTPHDAFYLAIAMFSRLVAVESCDAELGRLTAEYCRRLARLCATLSDESGEVISAGVRVPLAKAGREQKRPVHSALTAWWRLVTLRSQTGGFDGDGGPWFDPMYVGLRAARVLDDDLDDPLSLFNDIERECPGAVRLARTVIVHRWPEGHQVEIPRRGNESGMTKGSATPNGTCSWVRATYGAGKRGASKVQFAMLWEKPAPEVPKGATKIVMGPNA
jgi:hypothetical protein